MFTTTAPNDFEVFGDATFVGLEDRFDDALAEPVERHREFLRLLDSSAMTIPPSDLPAGELPEYEPTAADLLAIEFWDEDQLDARLHAANTLSAYEARHRDLMVLRGELAAETVPVEPETFELAVRAA